MSTAYRQQIHYSLAFNFIFSRRFYVVNIEKIMTSCALSMNWHQSHPAETNSLKAYKVRVTVNGMFVDQCV